MVSGLENDFSLKFDGYYPLARDNDNYTSDNLRTYIPSLWKNHNPN